MESFRIIMWVRCFVATLLLPIGAQAQNIGVESAGRTVRHTGVSGLWILANISYAGMRAQGHQSVGWRILSFIFGFPGTLLSFLVIHEGSGRAYGIDIPKRLD